MADCLQCRIQVHSPILYWTPESLSCYHWMWKDISTSPNLEVSALYPTHTASKRGHTVTFQIQRIFQRSCSSQYSGSQFYHNSEWGISSCYLVSQVKIWCKQKSVSFDRTEKKYKIGNLKKKSKVQKKENNNQRNPILLTATPQFHSQVWAKKWLVMPDPIHLTLGLPPLPNLLLSTSAQSTQWVTEPLIQLKSIWFSSGVSFQLRSPAWSNSPWGHAIAVTHPQKSAVRKWEAPHLL